MTDDLITSLQTAGDLLDERAAEATDALATRDAAHILPLAPALPTRRPSSVWLGAAAALLLVMAAAAVTVTRLGDDSTPVASAPTTVALVPSSGVEGWDTMHLQEIRAEDRDNPEIISNDTVIVVPSDAPEDRARSVAITVIANVVDESGGVDVDGAENVNGAGLSGQLARDTDSERVQLFIDADIAAGSRDLLLLATGPGVSTAELFELAAAIDLGTPLSEQVPADGWTIRTSQDAHLGSVSRVFDLNRSVPATYDSEWLSVITITQATDDVMWMLAEPYLVSDAQVRGKPAWILEDPWRVSITWVEAPGVVVQVAYEASDATGAERLAAAMAAAEDLVAVDLAGWARFAVQADDDATGMTTTTLDPASEPTFPRRPGTSSALTGQLDTGEWYEVFVVDATSQVCVAFDGEANPRCEPSPDLARGGENASVPRFVGSGGGSGLAYGFLPEGAEYAEVVAVGPGGREVDLGMATSGDLWVTPVPSGYELVEVTYFAAAATEIETHSFD